MYGLSYLRPINPDNHIHKKHKNVHACVTHARTYLGFLSLRARPSLARKSAMLTNCPILLGQNSVTGTGRSSVNSCIKREERETQRETGAVHQQRTEVHSGKQRVKDK